jgi:hypothetical protein
VPAPPPPSGVSVASSSVTALDSSAIPSVSTTVSKFDAAAKRAKKSSAEVYEDISEIRDVVHRIEANIGTLIVSIGAKNIATMTVPTVPIVPPSSAMPTTSVMPPSVPAPTITTAESMISRKEVIAMLAEYDARYQRITQQFSARISAIEASVDKINKAVNQHATTVDTIAAKTSALEVMGGRIDKVVTELQSSGFLSKVAKY